MPSYSLYQQISQPQSHTYKLLQLPPDLVEYMKNKPNGSVVIKSSPLDQERLVSGNAESNLVLCTDSKTWKLRQMNKSSAVLLLDNMNVNKHGKSIQSSLEGNTESFENMLLGFSQTGYEYELTDSVGSLNFSRLPSYSGDIISDSTLNSSVRLRVSMQELIDSSPISTGEFYKTWYAIGGCEVDGIAQVLSNAFLTDCLSLVIVLTLSNQSEEFTIEEMYASVKTEQALITKSMVETVVHKFSREGAKDSPTFSLDKSKVAQWYGIQQLAKHKDAAVSEKDFFLYWKQSLPEFYNVPLDLEDLKGHYYRPLDDKLQYLNIASLSNNLSIRFSQLFKLSSRWNYPEFIPYIMEFVPSGKSVDSIILKHGKKKKISKDKFVVTQR